MNHAIVVKLFHPYSRTLGTFPKILIQTAQVPKLLDGAKILPKISTLWVRRNVTDRRQIDIRRT